jgi:hypothetical protein
MLTYRLSDAGSFLPDLSAVPACLRAESIDMWGCGCVFGELLQRVAWIGKATTPQLQVRTTL